MAGYTSPGAAFGSAFDNFLMQEAQRKHQDFMDELAQKREQRMAQADLDSHHERQDEIRRKQQKDAEDARKEKVKDFEKRVGNMVAGDRPDPELLQQEKDLGLAGTFRQSAPVMSTTPMQPPAALMPNAPPDAPVEGTSTDTPAQIPGAMTPGPTVYPGSAAERLKAKERADQQAFVDTMDDSDPRKQELKAGLAAEAAGLKLPAGYFSKAATATKHRIIFDPKAKTYVDGITHQPITDAADLENAQVDRAADPTAQSDAHANHAQSVREHAYAEFKDLSKPLLDRIDRADKLEASLNQHTDIADSTIAEQLVTLTAGGAGSGIRISQPMIDQVLNKSRTRWSDFEQALKRWSTAPPDKKGNLGLFFDDDQRKAITDLGRAYRAEALKTRKKILDYRRQIDDAPDDIRTINKIRTAAQTELVDPADGTEAPAAKGLTVDDVFAKFGKPPGAK